LRSGHETGNNDTGVCHHRTHFLHGKIPPVSEKQDLINITTVFTLQNRVVLHGYLLQGPGGMKKILQQNGREPAGAGPGPEMLEISR
jgi:hypothetical protein